MTDEEIDRITLAVYRARLDETCQGDADSMVKKDAEKNPNDNGQMQARRSKSYRSLVIEVLVQAGFHTRPVREAPPKKVAVIPEPESAA